MQIERMILLLSTNITIMLIIYMPFHLLDEAIGNFPEWMYKLKWMPEKLTFGHWFAKNVFMFWPVQLLMFGAYYLWGESVAIIGLGLLFWGIFNFLEHVICSIIKKTYSPGLISAILFGINSFYGMYIYYQKFDFSWLTLSLSFLIGAVTMGGSIFLAARLHEPFKKRFS